MPPAARDSDSVNKSGVWKSWLWPGSPDSFVDLTLKNTGHGSQVYFLLETIWLLNPIVVLPSCVTLGQFFTVPEPQFPNL